MPDTGSGSTALAAERVADSLRERIIEGDFRGGDALRESSLAAGMSVSRNTVREAFRLLARDGLVVHEQHRGVRVRRLSPADVSDIYRVRRAIELPGLTLVDPLDLASVVAAAEDAARAGDWRAVSTADLRFHQQIVAAVGSSRLDAMFVAVLAELRLAFTALSDAGRFHQPYLERNATIVDLLQRGEVGSAVAELADYLDTAEEEITAALRLRDGD